MTQVEKDIAAVEKIKNERLLKKAELVFQKRQKLKQERQERLVAPVILFLTLITCVVLLIFARM